MAAAALLLAGLGGEAYQRTGSEYVRYEGVGPGWDSTRVVVGGWPLPYLLDKPYLSPVNSVGFVSGLLGEDFFRPLPFLADAALFAALLLALRRLLARVRKGGRQTFSG